MYPVWSQPDSAGWFIRNICGNAPRLRSLQLSLQRANGRSWQISLSLILPKSTWKWETRLACHAHPASAYGIVATGWTVCVMHLVFCMSLHSAIWTGSCGNPDNEGEESQGKCGSCFTGLAYAKCQLKVETGWLLVKSHVYDLISSLLLIIMTVFVTKWMLSYSYRKGQGNTHPGGHEEFRIPLNKSITKSS